MGYGLAVGTGSFSAIERDLVQAVAAGRELTCGDLDPASLANSDDKRYVIRAEVIRDLLLGRHVEHLDPRGLRLAAARISGTLDLDRLASVVGIELSGCAFDEPVTMRGARLPWLTLFGTQLPALNAEGLQVDSSVYLRNSFRDEADSEYGAVRLVGARIGGNLDCDGAVLTNTSGPALDAEGLQVDRSVYLRNSFRAEADSEYGAVRLVGARIGGNLECDGAVLTNTSGPALAADGLQVDSSVYLRNSFRAEADSEYGAVRLLGARIGGNLECDAAVLTNMSGPALVAEGLQVDSSVFLRDDFRASGRGEIATIRLNSARIGNLLDFRKGQMRNPDGLALDLRSTSIDRLRLPANAVCRSDKEDDPQSWQADGQLNLDGFTYSLNLPDGADLLQWLRWLSCHTPAYAAQPYQQLASTHRAAGHETAARQVLITQQDDLLARGQLGGRRAKTWHRFKRVTLGYGYQSWRALIALTVVVLLAVALGLAAGHIPTGTGRYVTALTPATGRAGTACSTLQQVGLGLDLGLPAVNTGITSQCNLDATSPAGQALTAIAWLLQAAAWALLALVAVGYTGLIRNT